MVALRRGGRRGRARRTPRSYSSALSTPGNHRPTGAILGEHVHWIQVVSAIVAHGGVTMPNTAIS